METSVEEGAWLLFDGDCGFCTEVAQWVEGRDRGRRLRVAAYQDAPRPPMTPELRDACAQAMHVITARGRVLRGGEAAIFTLHELGWRGLARVLWLRPLRDVVGFGYRIVVRLRGPQGCRL